METLSFEVDRCFDLKNNLEHVEKENDENRCDNGLNKQSEKIFVKRPKHRFHCKCESCRQYHQIRLKQLKPRLFFKGPVSNFITKLLLNHDFNRLKAKKSDLDELCNLFWLSPASCGLESYAKLRNGQMINSFPHSYEVTRKDNLYDNIMQHGSIYGEQKYSFMPQTFILPRETAAFEALSQKAKELNNHGRFPNDDKFWIVKPVNNACGRGIKILEFPFDITHKYLREQTYKKSSLTVSRYLQSPFLIDGKKIDLRVYALVNSFSPLRIYIYKEGLVRSATENYSLRPSCLSNRLVHLTNSSVQKQSKKYMSGSSRYKLSFAELKQKIVDAYSLDEYSRLFYEIEQIVVKTLHSIEEKIVHVSERIWPRKTSSSFLPKHCFQLFGFDIFIERNCHGLKPRLLEVNGSPGMNLGTQWDKELKPRMICELLNLVGLPAVDLEKQQISQLYLKAKSRLGSRKKKRPQFIRNFDDEEIMSEKRRQTKDFLVQRIYEDIQKEKQRSGDWKLSFPIKDGKMLYKYILDNLSPQEVVSQANFEVCTLLE
eukprot:snap_masked-scaffold_3-processed-gene-18.40-mRNA-1 protein AED:0.37 eAED:0.37 QI:0/-1/0/1/-1/1/1/0/542